MSIRSAGVLVCKISNSKVLFLLAHPGGPYWKNKDVNAWSIPKGIIEEEDSDSLSTAMREFSEETGIVLANEAIYVGEFKQPSRKIIHVWAVEEEVDIKKFKSNVFEMEWPPKSSRMEEFPEVDKIEWYPYLEAKMKIHKGQVEIIDAVVKSLGLEEYIDQSQDRDDRGPESREGYQANLF